MKRGRSDPDDGLCLTEPEQNIISLSEQEQARLSQGKVLLPFDVKVRTELLKCAADAGDKLVIEQSTHLSLMETHRIYPLALSYIHQHSTQPHTSISILNSRRKLQWRPWGYVLGDNQKHDESGQATKKVRTEVSAGLGVYRFPFEETIIYAINQRTQSIIPSLDGAAAHVHELVILTTGAGQHAVLQAFCDALLAEEEKTSPNSFNIFSFMGNCGWRKLLSKKARSIESVVLPKTTKAKVIEDLEEFIAEDTCNFFVLHGIPYKRTYMFHGIPGSGKTSLIQAVAGQYQYNLCFLHVSEDHMNDNKLCQAIQSLPTKSIVVLEDVDSLFGRDRESTSKNNVTFSGVLNALDGIATPQGQIFILTTNHREKLDPALIRNGRIDVHVEFGFAIAEQIEDMWKQFYPKEADLASQFRTTVVETLGHQDLSMATLQHFFVCHRKQTAKKAIESVGDLLTDMLAARVNGTTLDMYN